MAVDHNEWWSAFTPPSYAGADLTHELQSNLHRYIERFGDVRFGITSISDQQAKEVVMTDFEILREHGSFEAYHQKFLSYAPIPGYAPEDRWPLILAKDTYPSAFIDGYARLHSYLRSGHRDVPVIFFADQHQL
jgi:hypothetical protein